MLTEWTRQRYGIVAAFYLSILTWVNAFVMQRSLLILDRRLVTLFLYMVAELSALQQVISALTGLDGLPAVIVEVVVTTLYTCLYQGAVP